MKKTATYYLIAIGILNAFFAWVLIHMANVMRETLSDALGGQALPPWTSRALALPWWPYLVTGACVVAALLSLLTRVKSRKMHHAVIIILAVDVWLMFATVVAYVIPWITLDVGMSG